MKKTISILIVEDESNGLLIQRKTIAKEFQDANIAKVRQQSKFSAAVSNGSYDLAIIDYDITWAKGDEIFNKIYQKSPNAAYVFFTNTAAKKIAKDTQKVGLENILVHSREDSTRLVEIIKGATANQFQKSGTLSFDDRFESLFDDVPIGLFRASFDGELLYINDALASMFDYNSRKALIATSKNKSFKQASLIHKAFEKSKGKGEIRNYEIQTLKRDGTPIFLKLNAQSYSDKSGKFLYFEGSLDDITESKKIEDALIQSEGLNKAIIESANEGFIVFDKDLRYVVFNKFMEEITGIKEKDILGKEAAEIPDHLIDLKTDPILDQVLQGEHIHTGDIPFYIPQTGRTGWIEAQYGPLTSSDGEVIGVVVTIHDITERKTTETEHEAMLDQESQRAQEMAALAAIGTTISSNLNIDQVLKTVAEQMVNMLAVSSCAISIWDQDKQRIYLQAEHTLPSLAPTKDRPPFTAVSDLPSVQYALNNQTIVQFQPDSPGIPAACQEYLKDRESLSILLAPLISQNRTIGLIELTVRQEPRVFSDHEMLLTGMFANQAAVAMENAKLFENTNHQLKELTVLHAISVYGAEASNEDDLIEYATQLIFENFYPENFGVLLLHNSGEYLTQHHSYRSGDQVKYDEIPLNTGVTGRVAKTGKAELVPNVLDDPDYLTYDDSMRSEICVPLTTDDKLFGVINAESSQPDNFNADDERLMITLAGQIAVAIQKNRTQKSEARHTQRLAILNELAKDMTGILNVQELSSLVTHRLHSDFGYLHCGIFTWNAEKETLNLLGASGFLPPTLKPGIYKQSIHKGLLGKAIRKNMTVLSNDVTKDPDYLPPPDKDGATLSELVIPLNANGKVIGAIMFDHDQKNAFEQSDVSTLSTLADQIAITMEKLRLFEKEKRQREEAETLREVVEIISNTINRETLLDLILAQLIKVVSYDGASIMQLIDEKMVIQAVGGKTPKSLLGQHFTVEENKVSHPIIYGSRTVNYDNVKEVAGWINSKETDKITSWIGAPLIVRGKSIGILTIDGYQEAQFNSNDVELVTTFARHAANALDNARLFEETKGSLEREQQLNKIIQRLSAKLNTEFIFEDVIRLTCESVNAEGGSFGLLSTDGKSISYPYIHNQFKQGIKSTIQLGEGVAWQVIDSKEPLIIQDYTAHPQALTVESSQALSSYMAAPVFAGKKLIGIMSAVNFTPDKTFSQRDLDFLASVSQQAGVAIQNANLFEETQRRTNELSALYDIALATSAILDSDSLIEQLESKIESLLSPDSYSISLYDKESNNFEIVTLIKDGKPDPSYYKKQFSPKTGGLNGLIFSKRKTIHIHDLNTESLPKMAKPKADIPKLNGLRSWLGVPMINRDELVGSLVVKSYEANKFSEEDRRFLESMAGQISTALENARLYEELEEAFVQTVLALANAMDIRDSYTHDHSQRMAYLAYEVGMAMGFNTVDLETLRLATLLHDIGKIGIPDDILLKPAKLTQEEYTIIKRHPALGAEIVAPVKKLSKVGPIIRSHQEKWDGSGYPDGLKKDKIPLGSRVLAVVDSYIAMTDERIYRKALSHDDAIKEINKFTGKQYDPEVVRAFKMVISEQKRIEINKAFLHH